MVVYNTAILVHVDAGSSIKTSIFKTPSGVKSILRKVTIVGDSTIGFEVILKLMSGDRDILPNNGYIRPVSHPLTYQVDTELDSDTDITVFMNNYDTSNAHAVYIEMEFDIIG